jgi:hypothetical protein
VNHDPLLICASFSPLPTTRISFRTAAPGLGENLLALDEALARLAKKDPVKAKLVMLRHFAGLTVDQAAHALGISPATADRYWAYARAWAPRRDHRRAAKPSVHSPTLRLRRSSTAE